MIRRTTPKTHRYWFEEDGEDFWYDELDLRFVIPGLVAMAFSLPLMSFVPPGWPRIALLVTFLSSFIVVGKKKGKWF